MNFRTFKQVPRLLYGTDTHLRWRELLSSAEMESTTTFIIDEVHRESRLIGRLGVSEDQVEWFPAAVKEPSTQQVDEIRDRLLARPCFPLGAIVGIGGGSTMDVAKAVSVMLTNAGSSSEYQGWDLVPKPGIYKIGVPTVSGSGAEASRTAVLMGKNFKFGINSDYSMFDAIILDSSLIGNVPLEQRFYTGMDCYIHCVESLQGTMINELARGYANKALELCEKVFLSGGSDDEMMTASYLGGVSIVNSEVGVCHALSYGLSMELGYRHGFANCIAFNVLDEFYGSHVDQFRKMLEQHQIVLPSKVCQSMDAKTIGRMVDMTLRMERPLTNALGADWQQIMTAEKITQLYMCM